MSGQAGSVVAGEGRRADPLAVRASRTPAPGASPLDFVAEHVGLLSTGEVVVAADALEVHLYLQAGRVAWGTTTEQRFVFRRHLLEQHGLSEEALQQVVEEAWRAGCPLGEALVRRALLTVEQVREALKAQVVSVVRSLGQARAPAALFLPRGDRYLAYDTRLTFEWAEVSAP